MSANRIDIRLCQTINASGETVRYQTARIPMDSPAFHLEGRTDGRILLQLKRLMEKHLLPKNPEWKSAVLFSPDAEAESPFPERDGELLLVDPLARARYWMEKYRDSGSRWLENTPSGAFLDSLINREKAVYCGPDREAPFIVPVFPRMTLLSDQYDPRKITINSHFFLMELSDIPTPWDAMGEPYGLRILNGRVDLPPLYGRETLLWSQANGTVIEPLDIRDITVVLNGEKRRHNGNAFFYSRPEYEVTPRQGGTDWVVVGRKIIARNTGGDTPVPEAGFICHVSRKEEFLNPEVTFHTAKEWTFGIQGGTALIRKGRTSTGSPFPFFDGTGIPFPPTVFPLDQKRDRAARTGLGIEEGEIFLICVEGSKEHFYRHGEDSTGVSLSEFTLLAADTGVRNFISLDGGGSSQMSIYGKRWLRTSDRDQNGKDFERPVPAGLGFDLS